MILIETDNATEAMLLVFQAIRRDGKFVGKTSDILDVHLVIRNPVHSLTHMRKQHWVWALQEGSDRLNPNFENPGQAYRFRPNWQKKLVKEEGKFCYTYGEVYCIQLPFILKKLKAKQTREAIINMWESPYLFNQDDRTPCTLTLHFLIRDKLLHLFVNMRTNDATNLLPYDIWHHCLLQRYVAAKLGLGLGAYHHHADHMYVPKRRITTGNLSRVITELVSHMGERDYYSSEDFQTSTLDADMEAHYVATRAAREGDFKSAVQWRENIVSNFVSNWTALLLMAEGNARGYKAAIPITFPEFKQINEWGYHLRSR